MLVRSSFSSNIKERRDCSAALFDARGRMVAQAEHIPVHLGAMPESVAAVIALGPASPARPGSSTTRSPAARTSRTSRSSPRSHRRRDRAFACTRAHHSDVGGIVPGSLPATSTSIWQEGLILPPVRLDRRGRSGCCSRTCARPRSGGPTSRRSWPRTGRRRAPARAALPARGGVRRRDRLRRAPRARGDRAAPRRPLRGRGRGRDRTRTSDPGRGHRRRRPDRDRLRGHGAGGRRRT